MCGIAGFVGNGSRTELEKMQRALQHRGPDSSGLFLEGAVGLAHTRLAIIDVSAGGHQPMFLPDKSVSIVFNGEIFNYRALRAKLAAEGYAFRSESDTEVLLALYATRGENFLKEVVGQFAVALYDFKKKRLLLARDRMGEKPLYYYAGRENVRFASELGALLDGGVPKKLNLDAVEKYLLFDYVPTPQSIITGVKKVPPATLLVFEMGRVRESKFWHPPTLVERSEREALALLDAQLQTSVARTMVADVPLGVFLSGGIDSSTVAYYAQHASARPIETFSIGFKEKAFDESAFARVAATALGTNHHEEMLSADDALALVPNIADTFSEPVADASVLPTLLLSRFARKHVTVALGGDGGDELFAGYPTFFAERIFPLWHSLPATVRDALISLIESLPASTANFTLSYNLKKLVSSDERNPLLRHQEWLGSFPTAARTRILGPALINQYVDWKSPVIAFGDEIKSDTGNKLLYSYLRTYLMDEVLVKVDRASMHYALETRAPLLDHEVVDLVFSLPYSLKYRNGTNKYLLKKLMAGKLPPELISRKKKGFGIPLAAWLRGALKPLCEELLSPASLNVHELFNAHEAQRLMDEHQNGRRDNRKELWNLMTFQLWYDRWIK